MIVVMVYANPEEVRVQESEILFEMMKAEVTDYQEASLAVQVMGDFNAHIGLGAEQSPSRNGRTFLDLVGMCNLPVGNQLSQCSGDKERR